MAGTAAPQAYARVKRRTVAPAKGKPSFKADMEVASLDAAQVAKLPCCDSWHGAARQWSSGVLRTKTSLRRRFRGALANSVTSWTESTKAAKKNRTVPSLLRTDFDGCLKKRPPPGIARTEVSLQFRVSAEKKKNPHPGRTGEDSLCWQEENRKGMTMDKKDLRRICPSRSIPETRQRFDSPASSGKNEPLSYEGERSPVWSIRHIV